MPACTWGGAPPPPPPHAPPTPLTCRGKLSARASATRGQCTASARALALQVWYGVPASATEALEEAMRDALPHLLEASPNLLYQLVTMLSPNELKVGGLHWLSPVPCVPPFKGYQALVLLTPAGPGCSTFTYVQPSYMPMPMVRAHAAAAAGGARVPRDPRARGLCGHHARRLPRRLQLRLQRGRGGQLWGLALAAPRHRWVTLGPRPGCSAALLRHRRVPGRGCGRA